MRSNSLSAIPNSRIRKLIKTPSSHPVFSNEHWFCDESWYRDQNPADAKEAKRRIKHLEKALRPVPYIDPGEWFDIRYNLARKLSNWRGYRAK